MTAGKLHLWKNKRFTRLLAGNFALWASVFGALVLCVLLISRQHSVQSVYEQMGETNRFSLEKRINDMENSLKNKRHILLRLANDVDVEEYLRMHTLPSNTYEQIKTVNSIREDLMSYCLWDEHISSLFIYHEKLDQLISSDYGLIYRQFYEDDSWYEAYEQLKQGTMVKPFLRKGGKLYGDRTMLTLMQSVPIILNQRRGVAVINLDQQPFFDGFFGEMPYVIVDENGKMLCSKELPAQGYQFLKETAEQKGNHLIRVDGREVLITADYSENYGWWIYSVDLLESYNERIQSFDNIMSILIAAGLLLVLVFSYMLSVRMFVPVKHIMYVLEERRDEMIMPADDRRSARGDLMLMAEAVSHTLDRNKELSSILEERLQRLKQVRLRMLQSQVDPHFLYNTLASINWMALEKLPDDNAISDALCSLSELLRERLKNTGFLSLRQEMEQVDRYVNLQKLRFGDLLVLETKLDEQTQDCAVPPMILQTLVENAIKHGRNRVDETCLHISISSALREDGLHLNVADDGVGMTQQQLTALHKALEKDQTDPTKAIGLSNVTQQLRLLFPQDASIQLNASPGKGFVVEIVMPNIKIGDLAQTDV